jgi:hypothetical protein
VHAPFCHLWPARLYNIFSTFLYTARFSKKTLLKVKVVFRFSLQLLFETFFIIRRIERDVNKNVYWSSCKVPVTSYYCQILIKLEFSGQIFEKYCNTTFHENPSSKSRDVPCGQTDRHNEANGHFSKFCERA